jgi:SWI/SNF-related matrix-associated actin-dependent regulator of chromatin subfamily A-like protein 1
MNNPLDITEAPTHYEVKFQYKPYLVDAIKRIPGRRFDGNKKAWIIPLESGSALKNWAANFGVIKVNTAPVELEVGEVEPLPNLTINIPLLRQPFPYQNNGIAYAIEKRRCIFGDQPGLGKTGQAIAAATGLNAKCILVICPATLRENWKREWKIWTGKEALILNDRVKTTWPTFYKTGFVNVFICNYESLKKYFVEEIKQPVDAAGKKKPLRLNHIVFKETVQLFDTVIVDESHRCKDGKTQQAKFVMGISRLKENIFALTGTPVVNKPVDLIPQLTIINRLMDFGGYTPFKERYCNGANEASNLKELNYRLHKYCFFRREKKDVLKDLPDKMRNIVRSEISNRAEYTKAENDLVTYLRENLKKSEGEINKSLRGETMVLIQILKKISARGKIEEVIEHIQEVVDAGEKIVVFAHHKEIVQELKKATAGAVTIVGDDSMDDRQRAVDSFQNDKKTQVIICNIKSGGVGITLTASSRVVFIELPWHPADCEQCEDRCHRIGQKDSVQATYFLGHETIDEYIYKIIESKRKIANEVTGAKEEIETNILDEFINLFMKDKM